MDTGEVRYRPPPTTIMPQWTWKNATSQSVQKNKTHQPRTLSYEWTPPIPEKPYPIRTAISSLSLSVSRQELPPPYSSPTPSLSNAGARGQPLPDCNSSVADSCPTDNITSQSRHSFSSESYSDSSSDNVSLWSSSDVEEFFDNIYLEFGPPSRRPSSGRSLQAKFPESPLEELPTVYGLSFPAVPITTAEQLKTAGINKVPFRPIHRMRSEAMIAQRNTAPSTGCACTEELVFIKQHPPIPRRRYKSTSTVAVSLKYTKPNLDEHIEALRRELEFLTSNHPSQVLGQETRSIMLKEAARQGKEASTLRRRQDKPV